MYLRPSACHPVQMMMRFGLNSQRHIVMFLCMHIISRPHNLFGYNPNLMMRYMPQFTGIKEGAPGMQNNTFYTGQPPIYTPPYTSEWKNDL